MKIESVVFDLDNTLFPESEYFEKVLVEFSKELSIPISIFSEILLNFDEFRATKPNIFKFILNTTDLYCEKNYDLLFEIYTTIQTQISPYPEIENGILSLINKDLRLGVITNGVILSQHNKWKCLQLGYKEQILFKAAREYGQDKPSAFSFDSFMNECEFAYEKTIFVGDKFKNDIEYPMSQGGKGILITNAEYNSENIICFQNTSEAILEILNGYR